MTNHLFIIDAQQDFCDGPCQGALAVPGAHEDMLRLAKFIENNIHSIDEIHASMDCHRLHDIAHPAWWRGKDDQPPPPFTIIQSADIESGTWRAAVDNAQQRSLDYVRTLEKQGNYPLCIWPPHCLIGSRGQSLHPAVFHALTTWEDCHGKNVSYVIKGTNPWTEHYSALCAEVLDPEDQGTQINNALINNLKKAETVIIAGEALSHCVKATVTDLAKGLGPQSAEKFVLLTDTSSNVPGFEHLGAEFCENLCAQGMQLMTTVDYKL